MTRRGLQFCPPEICSLICQDPILERFDLNSICFVSHAFRNEVQRELSCCFPCLRNTTASGSDVKTWCFRVALALKRQPHLATNIKGRPGSAVSTANGIRIPRRRHRTSHIDDEHVCKLERIDSDF